MSAGASFQTGIATGKFHGVISADDAERAPARRRPRAGRRLLEVLADRAERLAGRRSAGSAPRAPPRTRASRSGLPISGVMSCAICSTRASSASAAALRGRRARGAGERRPGGEGRAAAATAASRRPRPRRELADRLRRAPRVALLVRLARRRSAPTRRRRSSRGRAGRSASRSRRPPSSRSVASGDGVRERADPGERGSRPWPGCEREVVGRHEARARQQHAPGGTGLSRRSQCDELREQRFMRAVDVLPENSSRRRPGDAQPDLERRRPSRRAGSAGPIAQAPAKILACGR